MNLTQTGPNSFWLQSEQTLGSLRFFDCNQYSFGLICVRFILQKNTPHNIPQKASSIYIKRINSNANLSIFPNNINKQ